MDLSLHLMTVLIVKHFVIDFLYQPAWMYKNKGTLFHLGGITHALFHGAGTVALLDVFLHKVGFYLTPEVRYASIGFWAKVMIAESLVHYLIDYSKMNIGKYFNWKPDNSEQFWYLMGFDQLLHYLTYVAIVAAITWK